MSKSVWRVVVACLFALGVVACAGLGSPTAPTSPPSASGAWAGNVTVQTQVAQMAWRLTQNGSSVSGPAVISVPGGVSLLTGTLSGVLNGAVLTYSITIAAGGLPAQPDCTARLDGSARLAQGTPSTLSGSYAMSTTTCASGFSSGTFLLTSGSPAMALGPIAPSG